MLGLVVAMTGAGVAGAQQPSAGPTAAAATGTLVFQHHATGRGTLGAAVRLFGDDDDLAGLTGDVADGGKAGCAWPGCARSTAAVRDLCPTEARTTWARWTA